MHWQWPFVTLIGALRWGEYELIAYIKGNLAVHGPGWVIIDVNGIGYQVFIPISTPLPQRNQEIKLHTHMAVREDGINIYGFVLEEEKDCFLALLDVAGVGPKVALAVISCLPPVNLRTVIASGEISQLVKVPGVGKKTAQRILLELKDKLQGPAGLQDVAVETILIPAVSINDDAITALQSLGYSQLEAKEAVRKASGKGSVKEVSKLITEALKELAPSR